jgi:hypothetical protein
VSKIGKLKAVAMMRNMMNGIESVNWQREQLSVLNIIQELAPYDLEWFEESLCWFEKPILRLSCLDQGLHRAVGAF